MNAPLSNTTIVGIEGDGRAMIGDKQDAGAVIGTTSPNTADALLAMLKAPFSNPFENSFNPLIEPDGESECSILVQLDFLT